MLFRKMCLALLCVIMVLCSLFSVNVLAIDVVDYDEIMGHVRAGDYSGEDLQYLMRSDDRLASLIIDWMQSVAIPLSNNNGGLTNEGVSPQYGIDVDCEVPWPKPAVIDEGRVSVQLLIYSRTSHHVFGASGVLLSSHAVLTAAHNLVPYTDEIDEDTGEILWRKGESLSFAVVLPAVYYENVDGEFKEQRPYGWGMGYISKSYVWKDWRQHVGETDQYFPNLARDDFAILSVDEIFDDFSVNYADVKSFSCLPDAVGTYVLATGYSAKDYEFFTCETEVKYSALEDFYYTTYIQHGGMSGGGLFHGKNVCGVLSGVVWYDSGEERSCFCPLTDEMMEFVRGYQAGKYYSKSTGEWFDY